MFDNGHRPRKEAEAMDHAPLSSRLDAAAAAVQTDEHHLKPEGCRAASEGAVGSIQVMRQRQGSRAVPGTRCFRDNPPTG